MRAYLLDKFASDGAHSADEEVEDVVFGEEERVVKYVQRLSEIFSVDNERDVCLRRTLGAGYDADAASTERSEQFAGYTGRVFHVLSHYRDGSKTAFSVHGEHCSRLNLFRELGVEHSYRRFGVGVFHTD